MELGGWLPRWLLCWPTRGTAGIAIGPPGLALGLDVEQVGRTPRAGVLKLARRRLAPGEVAALEGEV
jgi:hypothetical protein